MDADKFTEEEKISNDEIFARLQKSLKEFLEANPTAKEEATELQKSFDDLQHNYGLGKQAWYGQYRLTFQNKIMKPGLNGIRSHISLDFNKFYTNLSQAERTKFNTISPNTYEFSVCVDRTSESLLTGIEKCFSAFAKSSYKERGITQHLLTDKNTVLDLSIPGLSDRQLFKVTITELMIRLYVLYSGDEITDFDKIKASMIACIYKEAQP